MRALPQRSVSSPAPGGARQSIQLRTYWQAWLLAGCWLAEAGQLAGASRAAGWPTAWKGEPGPKWVLETGLVSN